MNNPKSSSGIVSIGAYAPPELLTNFDLEKIVDTSDEWIRTRTGIRTRHIASRDLCTSDVALPAGRLALERAGMSADELELIIFATMTPDAPCPSTACFLQHKLGATRAAALDVSAACSGFIYALSVANGLITSGQFANAMVVGADCLSKFTDFTDRSTCILLGDGGGAAILKRVPEGEGFQSFYLGADGSGTHMLTVPAGGSACPPSEETVRERKHFIRMSGNEVFKFAVKVIDESVREALDRADLAIDDVALIVPHQANIRIIEAAAKRLGISEERWANNIRDYGNTSAGTIPLALNEAYETGKLKKGNVVVLVGFGGGLTWGASVLRW